MTKVTLKPQVGNAYDALARLLARTLTVPQIFFEAPWPDARRRVDLLAIDRAGAGDVHVVEVKIRLADVSIPVVRQLDSIPAHYRWIAIPNGNASKSLGRNVTAALVETGIGTIDLIETPEGDRAATISTKAARAASFDRTAIGDFLKMRIPDIEYGEAPPASSTRENALLSKRNVEKFLDEADQLIALGHERAAFLLAWSAIEAAMKIRLRVASRSPMIAPAALIRALLDSSQLTPSEAKSLGDALEIRNALAHGLNSPPAASKAYRSASALARKLVDE